MRLDLARAKAERERARGRFDRGRVGFADDRSRGRELPPPMWRRAISVLDDMAADGVPPNEWT